jgi:hypothetical protein
MNVIVNTRADLDALRDTPAYGEVLRNILGSATTWVNTAPEGSPPAWQMVTVLSTIERMGFLSVNDLLAECAAAGVTPPAPPPAPSAPQPSKADLIAHVTVARDKTLTAGIIVNAAASGQPAINIHCDGLPQTRHDLNGFYTWGLDQVARNLAETRDWFDNDWNKYTLTGAQCVALALPVGTWADNVYGAAQSLVAQINSGAITTTAQIDAAVWPTS